jgi:glycosyltransferase involved in cell wall biosynthesis
MSHPLKISVITPSYNCARYIRECIESVRAQNYEHVEHIIIDGGSTDGTVDILKEYPDLIWVSERDKGEADALNKALKRVTGDVIYWLNADDVAIDSIFHLVLDRFYGGADVVYGKALIIDEKGTPLGVRIPKAPLSVGVLLRWFQHLHISQPSMFFRKAIFDRVGSFRDDLYFSIDLELWLRIAAAGYRFEAVDHVLSKARLIRQDAKSGASRESQEKNWLEVGRPYLEQLSKIEQTNFWKDYYLFYVRERAHQGINPSSDPLELVGLALALIELGMSQEAHGLVEQIVRAYPRLPDALGIASEFLIGRGDRAAALGAVQIELEEERAERKGINLPKLLPRKRALLLFPHMPYPPKSGAHIRKLAYVQALRDLDYDVSWFGIEQFSDTPWDDSSIERFKRAMHVDVYLARRTPEDEAWTAQRGSFQPGAQISWDGFTPPGLRREFSRVCDELQPDVIVISYALWAGLAKEPSAQRSVCILESHDLITLNRIKREYVESVIQELQQGSQDALIRLVSEDFYASLPSGDLQREFAQCDGFDCVVAIAPEESARFAAGLQRTPVAYIPGGIALADSAKPQYDGEPIFVIGPNPFNVQAYLYLAVRVIAQLRVLVPGATIGVIGSQSDVLPEVEGLKRHGFVEDLSALYKHAPFAVCPLIGGTGMQMKIVEAMAHGVPVIALKNMAGSSPIIHGVNGYIAESADEFVQYAEKLLRDRTLCRTLGQAARKTLEERYSQQAFTFRLQDALALAYAKKNVAK